MFKFPLLSFSSRDYRTCNLQSRSVFCQLFNSMGTKGTIVKMMRMMMRMMMIHSKEIRELETWRDTLADGRASSSFSCCMICVGPPSLHPSLPGPRLSEWREGVHYARWDTERQRGEGQQLQVVPYFLAEMTDMREGFVLAHSPWHERRTAVFWGVTCVS